MASTNTKTCPNSSTENILDVTESKNCVDFWLQQFPESPDSPGWLWLSGCPDLLVSKNCPHGPWVKVLDAPAHLIQEHPCRRPASRATGWQERGRDEVWCFTEWEGNTTNLESSALRETLLSTGKGGKLRKKAWFQSSRYKSRSIINIFNAKKKKSYSCSLVNKVKRNLYFNKGMTGTKKPWGCGKEGGCNSLINCA